MRVKRFEGQKWSELSPAKRTLIVVGGIVEVALLGAALWDIRSRPADQIRGGKGMWVAISFVNFVGPISYFVVGRKRDG